MSATDPADITVLVLDVDGVLTDGRVTYTAGGDELHAFSARDGAGMKYWKRAGGRLALISGRGSPAVERRAAELDVDAVRLQAKDKDAAFEEVLCELDVPAERVAVVCDDLTDIPMLRRCGYPVAVADAVEEVRSRAAYVTRACGGDGCVREVIELLLKASGRWGRILERYLPDGEAYA
ncbi:MAG: HAD hydrolase family protein [Phycisphaerae bacterium]|nr:HAD hydrolase family protein [Phycisphaerae bacterium]